MAKGKPEPALRVDDVQAALAQRLVDGETDGDVHEGAGLLDTLTKGAKKK